jgi:protein involved in polysaccharide export with SLBB domain
MLDNPSEERKKVESSLVQPSGVALESTIDPEKYYVGPSDVLAVNIWMSPPLNLSLTVTPEGTLIIPTVGELAVANLTLRDAKSKILQAVRNKYLVAEITATLLKPRPIIVTVLGSVLYPGLYTLSAVDRANRAIEEANKSRRPDMGDKPDGFLMHMSQRNIVLKHKDGSQDRVDITKFFATREDRWDPYLREGDVITVPRKNSLKNVIGVYGEVNAPGRYEFVEGDSLLDAIKIGQGFTRLANSDSIEFSRLSSDGSTIESRQVDLRNSAGFPLQPGDRIVVKAKADLREDYRVMVTGEVLHPGTYPITKNRTTLSEIIRQAGGFTAYASLASAELIRQSIDPAEIAYTRLLSMRGATSMQDSLDFATETELRLKKEFVTVDFKKLFVNRDSSQDVILQTEDSVYIPSVHQTVYVFGQVVSPGYIGLVNGKDYRYYVEKAGGFTDRARKGDIRIIKARTQQWIEPDKTSIEEGDFVWIPKEPDHPFSYYMTIASQTATVLSVVIGIAVLIVQTSK